MEPVQLELNLDNLNPDQLAIFHLKKQMEALTDSMGKVRRKLFAEIGRISKHCAELERHNAEISGQLMRLANEKPRYEYHQGEFLFTMQA